MKTCLYLRKSRSDEELERELGEGSTLSRHKTALLRYAKENDLNILKIHEELVSGDELFFRPAMLQMLKEIEQGLYSAVLVMDIQRLGRGDTEEQGLILKTFKKSNVKIMTPKKVYDLNNDFDEEYLEFEAFIGRKEYKMINRRMQGGRIRSVNEGNYIGTRPPYGFLIEKQNKNSRILIPHPEQSPIIKQMFDWYVNGNMGCTKIASELNKLGIKSYSGGLWERTAISNFLKNQAYIGKITWKKKCIRKSKTPGKSKDAYTRPKEEWIVSQGKHDPLIDEETFYKAQKILEGRWHVPYHVQNGVVSPLAGLVYCSVCDSKMKRRPYGEHKAHLICLNQCVRSNLFDSVEKRLLEALQNYQYELSVRSQNSTANDDNQSEMAVLTMNVENLKKEINSLHLQKNKLHDFLEQGIYDTNTFLERNKVISNKMEVVKAAIDITTGKIEERSKRKSAKEFALELQNVIESYTKTDDVNHKNKLLKTVLEKIIYHKEKTWKSNEFEITLCPKFLDLT